jgi:hypothetical protein
MDQSSDLSAEPSDSEPSDREREPYADYLYATRVSRQVSAPRSAVYRALLDAAAMAT